MKKYMKTTSALIQYLQLNVRPNYDLLESEVAVLLCFQVCSTCYTASHANNNARNTSGINPGTMEIMDCSHDSQFTEAITH